MCPKVAEFIDVIHHIRRVVDFNRLAPYTEDHSEGVHPDIFSVERDYAIAHSVRKKLKLNTGDTTALKKWFQEAKALRCQQPKLAKDKYWK